MDCGIVIAIIRNAIVSSFNRPSNSSSNFVAASRESLCTGPLFSSSIWKQSLQAPAQLQVRRAVQVLPLVPPVCLIQRLVIGSILLVFGIRRKIVRIFRVMRNKFVVQIVNESVIYPPRLVICSSLDSLFIDGQSSACKKILLLISVSKRRTISAFRFRSSRLFW